jgi:ABC-type multidrug transport system fused ATPase/permease subunit
VKEQSETPYRVTFARLLGFLHPYKISLIVSTLLAIASQGAQIALVWVTAHVIDDAIVPRDSGKLWVFVWLIIGLGALRASRRSRSRWTCARGCTATSCASRSGSTTGIRPVS